MKPIRKKNTYTNYQFLLSRFNDEFGQRDIESVSSEEVFSFLSKLTSGRRQTTRRSRYAVLSAFFSYIRNACLPELNNPCDNPMIRNAYRPAKLSSWDIVDKEIMDEVIFRETNIRNRLLLELMARGGLRVGEALKLRPVDVEVQKLFLRATKSGKEQEVVFIPKKVAQRLQNYIREKSISAEERIFSVGYPGARLAVKRAGNRVGVKIVPHDLRRHAATFPSRSGTPIEIVSKVILRHANLSTTQRYLGKVSDTEAIRWIETLYG